MLKRILIMSVSLAAFVACQDEEVSTLDFNDVNVTEISAENLPTNSQSYISENFTGEVITSAYQVSDDGDISYEAYLTNSMNLVFGSGGDLEGFGEDASKVDCGGKPHKRKGKHGHGDGEDKGERPKPTEINLSDLPTTAADYLTANYGDSTILKVLLIERDDITEYHVLVEGVGAVIFDADGAFVKVMERKKDCGNFESLAIEDLPVAVTDYISANYPDNEIVKARTGTRDGVVEIHVLVDEVGALIFDESGEFVELKTCGMDHT